MIIGLNGRKGSGKDTVYEIIRGFKPYARRLAFADKMKTAAAKSLGLDGSEEELVATMNACKSEWTFDVFAELGSTPWAPIHMFSGREYLQNFGAAMRDVYGDNFWIDLTLPTTPPEGLLVITDVRYWNEAQAVKDLGGKVWFIHRENAKDEMHLSEYPIAEHLIDEWISNNGTVPNLVKEVRRLL
jgi:hypothetical protein